MTTPHTWTAHPGSRGGASRLTIAVVVGLVLLGMLAAALVDQGSAAGDLLAYALPALTGVAVVGLVIVPQLRRGRGGYSVSVAAGALLLQAGRTRRALPVHGLALALSRVYAGGSYLGTLAILRAPRAADTVRLLGSGVELPQDRYDAPDTRSFRYDLVLDAPSFHGLLDSLAERGVSPTRAAPQPLAPAVAGAREQVFEATPDPMRTILKTVTLSVAALLGLALLGFLLHALAPPEAKGLVVLVVVPVLSSLALALPAFLFYRFRRGRRAETVLRLTEGSIVIAAGRRERFRVDLPPPETALWLWRTESRVGSFTQGPAVHLRNRMGREVTLGVRDPERAPGAAAKTVATVHYVVSADAGRALLDTLQRRGPVG